MTINKSKENDLSHEELLQILNYDPTSGEFTWLITKSHRRAIGTVAGCFDKSCGYISIMINQKSFRAHRLAWFYIYKVWPENVIDHINGIKHDNRISNLREATSHQNAQNRKCNTNKTELKNLCFDTHANSWRAQIVGYAKSHTKYSKDKQICIDWLIQKREELHKEFTNHGHNNKSNQ